MHLNQKILSLTCSFPLALALTVTPLQADDRNGPEIEIDGDKERLKEAFELPEEINELQSAYNDSRSVLRAELNAILDRLPKKAGKEEVAAAVEAFRIDNAEAIAVQKDLSQQLKEALREFEDDSKSGNHNDNAPLGDATDGLSEAAKAIKDQITNECKRLKEARKNLTAASEEERSQFIEDQKALKDLRKNFISDIRKEREDGDSRSNDDSL